MVYYYDGKNQAEKKPYSFNKKAIFCSVESITNPNTGAPVPTLVPEITLHYAIVKRSIEDKMSELGTNKQDIKIITVKHREKIQETMKVKIGEIMYSITSIMPDDSNTNIPYDNLILEKWDKRYRTARK